MSPNVAAAADSLSISVGMAQNAGKNAYTQPLPRSKQATANGTCWWNAVDSPKTDPAASSGTAVCQCRSAVLSECQPLISIPATPMRAGISSSKDTVELENPERRFRKV